MSIGLTEEHLALRDSVRGWASRYVTADVLRTAVEAPAETLPPFWQQLAEQGLLALHLPEEVGGAGFGLTEAAVVAEELGRALVPGPALPTLAAGTVLLDAGQGELAGSLADGSTIAAIGLEPGDLRLDGGVLTGSSAPVIGGTLADLFVLPARAGDDVAWVVLAKDGDGVRVEPAGAYDPSRRLARVTCENTSAAAVLDVDPARPVDLAAVLFAAEASGMAHWCVTTAAEYAKVRQQFGRPIGQFQGVKHRCARMMAAAEQARACAWDAARTALDDEIGPPEKALAARIAGALAPSVALSNAQNCIQVLGGIGYTWEHDAQLYMRRAHVVRRALGSAAAWQRGVAALVLDGVRRELGVELPPEAEQIRADVRAELEPAVALEGKARTDYLAEKGYTAPHLPAPWGKGADAVTQLVIDEEMAALDLTAIDLVIGAWVVPTVIEGGSDEQKQKYLPRTMNGELTWCQLFSEPGAGSDLAALSTKAKRVDGGWQVSGQKVWTSLAHRADYGILLARTDPDVAKHKGLSYFLLDMKNSEGLDIRPLREMTGEALFNEVFFNDVFVPDEAMVGEPGDGWKLARTTLANERVSLSNGTSVGAGGETLLIQAAKQELDDEHLTTLGKILVDASSLGLLALRSAIRKLSGAQPGAESSIAKLVGVDHLQEVWEVATEWQGLDGLAGEPVRGDAAMEFLAVRCMSIAGGTTEIQLNIIGERILGLPRDPQPGK